MDDDLNETHKNALELLRITHKLCEQKGITYTLSADTLIAYEKGLPFQKNIPIIYIALLYQEFCILKDELLQFCECNNGYSVHDYSNTKQFDTLDIWFVKHSNVQLSQATQEEAFYYGTRMVITPIFYAGTTIGEWKKTYRWFHMAIGAVNSRAVLKGKAFFSYVKLTKKRVVTNYLRKKRDRYSIEKILAELGNRPPSTYVLYPFIIRRRPKSPNALPRTVERKSVRATAEVWTDVRQTGYYGVKCYVTRKPQYIMNCFPEYVFSQLKEEKSQLLLNGYEDLRRVQQIQVELLTEFDRICRKYDLRYNISFGTLLGAVRHKGFIPWDDDIDVTMPWEDYNRLDAAMEQELDPQKYYLRTPENEENNHLIFKHLERKGTLYTKPGRTKLKQQIGVFIDIFPLYPSAPNIFLDFFHTKICRYWRTALWATIGADSEPSAFKRFRYRRMARPGNRRCYENFVRAATFFSRERNYLKFWIAMDRSPYKKPLVRMTNYTDAIELEFEGRLFLAPRNYEEVLDYCFGIDWRLYPVTVNRIPAHKVIVELGSLYQNRSEK